MSRNGVPVFLADVKGDLAGMAREGQSSGRLVAREAVPDDAGALKRAATPKKEKGVIEEVLRGP